MNYAKATVVGHEPQDWLCKLDFYRKDLDILNKWLGEIAMKNYSTEARSWIEHFQNQFLIQRNNMDELGHEIREVLEETARDIQHHAGHVGKSHIEKLKKSNEEMISFEKVMNDLRQEFHKYVAKWM